MLGVITVAVLERWAAITSWWTTFFRGAYLEHWMLFNILALLYLILLFYIYHFLYFGELTKKNCRENCSAENQELASRIIICLSLFVLSCRWQSKLPSTFYNGDEAFFWLDLKKYSWQDLGDTAEYNHKTLISYFSPTHSIIIALSSRLHTISLYLQNLLYIIYICYVTLRLIDFE